MQSRLGACAFFLHLWNRPVIDGKETCFTTFPPFSRPVRSLLKAALEHLFNRVSDSWTWAMLRNRKKCTIFGQLAEGFVGQMPEISIL